MSFRQACVWFVLILAGVLAFSAIITREIPGTGQHWSFAKQDTIAIQLRAMDSLLDIADIQTRKTIGDLEKAEAENQKLREVLKKTYFLISAIEDSLLAPVNRRPGGLYSLSPWERGFTVLALRSFTAAADTIRAFILAQAKKTSSVNFFAAGGK